MNEQVALERRFALNPEFIEAAGRSFDTMVDQRLCAAARRRAQDDGDSASPIELIRRYCGNQHDYLSPDLPIMEVLFRLFLLQGNQPAAISTIREWADDYPAHADRLRYISDESLISLLVRDRYYGFRSVDSSPGDH
jgi:hypothetical protein